MSLWTNLAGGLRSLLRKRKTELDMDEELRAFVDAATEQKMSSGMNAVDARRSAMVEMGSMESVKDAVREAGWEGTVEGLWRDLRFSMRVLAKAPLFTAVVVLTLALGIGANTAIFSLLDTILLRSLPVRHPEQLVQISDASFTNPIWEQVRDRQDVFSGAFAWSADQFNLSKAGMVQYASGMWVSGDFFRTLGLAPAAGRLLNADDDRRGCPPRAVLGYGFWQSRYGGETSAVGGSIQLNGHPFQIVGVAPRSFFGVDVGYKFDVAVPICAASTFDGPRSRLDARSWWWLRLGGRPKPGISFARLKARLAVLSPEIYGAAVPPNWDRVSQDNFRKRILKPEPMATGLSGLRKQYEEPLHVLMAVVAVVLLIACANIAGLLMARAAARTREMAMRQALGASRRRLIRQLLTECLILSFGGAVLGMLFARWGNAVLVRFLSTIRNKVYLDFSPDMRVLGFTAGVSILAALLFGMVPAFRGTRTSLTAAMKAPVIAPGGIRSRFRLGVVAFQVALCLVLLVTAGLLLRSFRNLASLDIGFQPRQVLLAKVNVAAAKVPKAQFTATYDRILAELGSVPGVASASRSVLTPLGNMEWNELIQSDAPQHPTGDASVAWFNFVSPSYFETLQTPLIAGRYLMAADTKTSAAVAVINQVVAQKFFPRVDPLGRTFRVEGDARELGSPVQVVGVVKDAKYESMREDTFPTVFRPIAQNDDGGTESFEVRTLLPAASMNEAIQKAVLNVNKDVSIEIHTLAAQVDDSMSRERLLATLAAFFGGLALVLAMIGLYGTLSYLIAQRRVEFGIRMALGAQSRSILALLMRDVVALLALGIAAGLGLSLAATRILTTVLFGLEPRDGATLAISAALLAVVSAGAGYLASRRATRLDPMAALRQE